MSISELKVQLLVEQKRLDQFDAVRRSAIKQVKALETEIKQKTEQITFNLKVQSLLRNVSEYAKMKVKTHIEDIVSNALNVIYGGAHKFELIIEQRRNQHEVDYYLDDGFTKVKIEKPFIGKGGGKISIVALALQLAICELAHVKGPICLDEISKMLDEEARVNLAYFLQEYSKKFNRQIVLITHHEELANIANVSIKVKKVNGLAKIIL